MEPNIILYIGASEWVPIFIGQGKQRKPCLWRNTKTDEHLAHAYMMRKLEEWCRKGRKPTRPPTRKVA